MSHLFPVLFAKDNVNHIAFLGIDFEKGCGCLLCFVRSFGVDFFLSVLIKSEISVHGPIPFLVGELPSVSPACE